MWHHQEWLKTRDHLSNSDDQEGYKKRHAVLKAHLGQDSIPSTLIALIDGQPIGSASVIYYQFSRNQFKSPWLTNVFVEENYRRQGIGRHLVEHACDLAKHAGVNRLQLYTHDKAEYYANLSWKIVRTGQVQRRPVAILEKSLS